jgi:hypothetical protein
MTPAAPVTTPEGAPPEGIPETVESLPEWAQKLVRSLRKENEKRRQDADAERAKAEEARLTEQQKWQELAAKREQERDELKPYRERYEALASQQRAALMAEVAKWPAEVKALLPGEDADVTVLGEAVTKARALVTALAGKTEAAAAHGNPPPPAGKAGMGADREANRKLSAVHFYRDL